MSSNHVYQRLEDLMEELNPAVKPYPLSEVRVSMLSEEIRQLARNIKESLHELFFRTIGQEVTAELIGKCYLSLVVLMNKGYQSREHHLCASMNLTGPLDALLQAMERMFHWFYQNFSTYIQDDQPYPLSRLMQIRAEILEETPALISLLHKEGNPEEAVSVVFAVIKDFLNRIERAECLTKGEVKYHQDILDDIRHSVGRVSLIMACPYLHEMLVYWNLNTILCIQYLRKGIEHKLNTLPEPERKDYLRLQYKYVQQLPERQGFIYDKRNPGIKAYLTEYLSREIEFLVQLNIAASADSPNERGPAEKIICNLSVDQISLILRAMYDLRIISAKSMSAFFKIMVSYLGTPNTENISWENMRKKCYTGERRDISLSREIALQVADKIETY